MNIKNILYILSLILLSVFVWTGCIDDDLVKTNDVEEGVPITVTMNLAGTGSSDVVVNTKVGGSDLSEISDLVLFIFHGDGSFEDVVTNYHGITTLKVNSNRIESGNHYHNVTFNTTSGTKKLLAVANVADGGYWEKVIDLLTVAYQKKYSFGEVKSEIVSLRKDLTDGTQPFHITASSQMFISGWNEGVVFGTGNTVTDYGTYGDEDNDVAVKMYRGMANVTFKIKADFTANDGVKGTFTPTTFRVYNIPTKSYLINDKQGVDAYTLTTAMKDVTYINTASENIGTIQGGSYTFDFYMPENIQEQEKNTLNNYADRDKWTIGEDETSVSGASPEHKTWVNAPQNSTFVVISGTYEGNATIDNNDNQSVTANVEYTIHLGDFSEETGSLNNFSVERNVSYTYNVKVLGVDNIIVEAKTDEERQSGAEGSIYDRTNTEYSYNLDAHYEQVYLEYNLSGIAESLGEGLSGQNLDEAIADQLILIIQSEMMSYTNEYSDEKPYTVRNNRGTLSPYKIYADAVRGKSGQDADDAAAKAKSNVLDGAGSGSTPTKGFDYKWIEFLPQTGTTLSEYPGISEWAMESLEDVTNKNFYSGARGTTTMLDVYDVIVEMGRAIKSIYSNEGKPNDLKIGISTSDGSQVARFTAFVNEYYYLHHPLTGAKAASWSRMTNKIPREMIIAMSTKTSKDGNSSYSKIHSYITQLAMQTFYNDELFGINAFGIETYNETPLYPFGTPNSQTGLTDDDGRENQKILIGASWYSPEWSDFVVPGKNGWTESVGTEHDKHKLNKAYVYESAYSACMSRNRDLNGNGYINEDEIRWFLASVNEYIRMGIGATAVSNAAQLFIGDKTTMERDDYPDSYIKYGSLYFTSSYGYYGYDNWQNGNKRVYWAIEKGSYGGNSNYSLPIRCIRNLPASGDGVSTDISSINGVNSDATYKKHEASGSTPIVLEFKNRLDPSLYRERVQGSLSKHNEDDDANKFYEGIFVASSYLSKTSVLGEIIGFDGTVTWENESNPYYVENKYEHNGYMINPCAGYSEGGYENWRVPNLVELSAMNAAGLLGHNGLDVACCTQFSNQGVRYGFAYSSLIYCLGNGVGDIANSFQIRCVRDVPAGFTFPTN